jgi:glycopeptide antibiotics resistance protein
MLPGGSRARFVVRALLVGYLAGLAAITLSPQPDDPSAFGWVRRTVVRFADVTGVPLTFPVAEAVGNVLLFVPFGLLVGLVLRRRRWLALPLGSATSALIETVQLAIPGRWTTLQDWVLNTVGTAAGFGVLALVLAARASAGAGDDEGRARRSDPASSPPLS